MRLFIGIPIPSQTIAQLRGIVDKLRRPGDGLRWSAPESWHITLQFLGECTPAQLECLQQQLAEVQAEPLPVRFGQPGIFDRSGVFLWTVELTEELAALHRAVHAATAPCGFKAEARTYQPHITLARDKQRLGTLARLKTATAQLKPLPAFTAGEFLLYESFLGPGGSRYEVRGRYVFDLNR